MIITVLNIICAVSGVLLAGGIFMHRAAGGGLSEVFGGAAQAAGRSSSLASRNVTRYTVAFATTWFASVILLGLLHSGANL